MTLDFFRITLQYFCMHVYISLGIYKVFQFVNYGNICRIFHEIFLYDIPWKIIVNCNTYLFWPDFLKPNLDSWNHGTIPRGGFIGFKMADSNG